MDKYILNADQLLVQKTIVDETLSWKGTPYIRGCKEKGKGVECDQLVIAPFKLAGIIPVLKKIPPQGPTAIQDKNIDPYAFRDFILLYAIPIDFDDRMAADIVTFYNNGIEHHVGVMVSHENVVDACNGQGSGRVRERRVLKIQTLCCVYRAHCLLDLTGSSDMAVRGKTQLINAVGCISEKQSVKMEIAV